jgi:hypothetical protein
MAEGIIFNSININAQETNSIVSVGQTTLTGFEVQSKNNFSIGLTFNAFGGLLSFPYNINVINDQDVSDFPVNDQDIQTSSQDQV